MNKNSALYLIFVLNVWYVFLNKLVKIALCVFFFHLICEINTKNGTSAKMVGPITAFLNNNNVCQCKHYKIFTASVLCLYAVLIAYTVKIG